MRPVIPLTFMISLVVAGCSLLGIGQHDEWQTENVQFDRIDVYSFEQDRLTFTGTRDGETSVYVYDMKAKTLIRKENSVNWVQSRDQVYYLGEHGKLTLNREGGRERLVLTNPDGMEKEVLHVSQGLSIRLSVSPNGKYIVYWTEDEGETEVHVYDVVRDEHTLLQNMSGTLKNDDVQWSANGGYVMLKQRDVYRVTGAEKVLTLEKAASASWSPARDQLVVLERDQDGVKLPREADKNYGHRIVTFDLSSGEKIELYPAEGEKLEIPPLVLDEVVWDDSGRLFAFSTGSVNGGEVTYDKVHIMDPQGGFHHVENEQNLRPSTVEDLTFSPDGTFFSYTANGLLKVLYIPTQQSKVYDVYTQLKDDYRYLAYKANETWILGSHEIKRLGKGLEEKTVYRSSHELLQFFISDGGDHLLVVERVGDHFQLKLEPVLEDAEETEPVS